MVAAAVRANVARRVAVVAAESGVEIAVSGEGVGEAVAARVFLAGGVPARGADAEELIVAVGDVLGASENRVSVRSQVGADVDRLHAMALTEERHRIRAIVTEASF